MQVSWGGGERGSLPTSHTCFNMLGLPDAENYQQLEKVKMSSSAIKVNGNAVDMIGNHSWLLRIILPIINYQLQSLIVIQDLWSSSFKSFKIIDNPRGSLRTFSQASGVTWRPNLHSWQIAEFKLWAMILLKGIYYRRWCWLPCERAVRASCWPENWSPELWTSILLLWYQN